MPETLKSFLVALDWKTEQTKIDQAKFEGAIESATLRANLLADALVAMAVKVGKAVKDAATKFDTLYFAAQRANVSPALANDFPTLIKKYGGDAGQAASVIQDAGRRLRENSHNITILNELGFGLNATTGKLEIQQRMLENLRRISVQDVETLTATIGISDQPILLMKRHLDEVLPDLKAFDDYRQTLGLNIDQATDDGHAFQTAWRDVARKLDAIGNTIGAGLGKSFTAPLEEFDAFLTANAPAIGKAINEVTSALSAMLGAWVDDFEALLKDPNALDNFKTTMRQLAETAEFIAHTFGAVVDFFKTTARGYDRAKGFLEGGSDEGKRGFWKQLWSGLTTGSPAEEKRIVEGLDAPQAPPSSGSIGDTVNKAWDWTKGKLGFAPKPAPAGPDDRPAPPRAPPASARASGNTVIFGDSIGAGLAGEVGADDSNAVKGKAPQWVADRIEGYKKSLAGKDVVISSGASNAPNDAATIQTQIRYAIDKGADPKRITVLGVGSLKSALGYYPGVSEKTNATLKKAATDAGAAFQPLPEGTDVHPDYRALAKSLDAAASSPPPAPSEPAAAPLPAAPAQSSPYRIGAPAIVPPVDPGAFDFPSMLGGVGGAANISAPTQTTIHIDGAGDPGAVAHLVERAQKGVNADLSQTLQGAMP